MKHLQFRTLTVFISDKSNLVAEETLSVALNYIRRNPRVGLMIDGLYSVKINGDDATSILETRKLYHDFIFHNIKIYLNLI